MGTVLKGIDTFPSKGKEGDPMCWKAQTQALGDV
jgi:hypothetical protein